MLRPAGTLHAIEHGSVHRGPCAGDLHGRGAKVDDSARVRLPQVFIFELSVIEFEPFVEAGADRTRTSSGSRRASADHF